MFSEQLRRAAPHGAARWGAAGPGLSTCLYFTQNRTQLLEMNVETLI